MENGEQELPRLVKKIDTPPLTPEQIQLRNDSILAKACRWEDAHFRRVEELTDAQKAIMGIVRGKIIADGYKFSEALEHPELQRIVLLFENEIDNSNSIDEERKSGNENHMLKPGLFRNSTGWGLFGRRNYVFHLESLHPKHEISKAIEGINYKNTDIVVGENLVIKKRKVKKIKGKFLFKREVEEEEAYFEKDGRVFVSLEFTSTLDLIRAQEREIETIKLQIAEANQKKKNEPVAYLATYEGTTGSLDSLEKRLEEAYEELVNSRVTVGSDPKPLFSRKS